MNIDERIYQALIQSHADDLSVIRHYVRWLKFRRQINQFFYEQPAHWIKPDPALSPKMPVTAFPILQERRRAYRVDFNAHWMNQ